MLLNPHQTFRPGSVVMLKNPTKTARLTAVFLKFCSMAERLQRLTNFKFNINGSMHRSMNQ